MSDSFILNRPFQIFSYAGKYPKYSTEALRNKSDRHTKRVVHRSASYAEELYEFSKVTNNSRLPSKTLKFPEVSSISVCTRPSISGIEEVSWSRYPFYRLNCLDHEYSLAQIDNLAKHFNVLTGKWWFLVVSSDEVDKLWERIAKYSPDIYLHCNLYEKWGIPLCRYISW